MVVEGVVEVVEVRCGRGVSWDVEGKGGGIPSSGSMSSSSSRDGFW